MASSASKVFISYSHDSPEHAQHVLELAERLRKDGADAQIDQYVAGTPPEGWPRWMLDRLDWAEFVLVVCTETYYRRFRGQEEPSKGKGADWEGNLITLEIYDRLSSRTRYQRRSASAVTSRRPGFLMRSRQSYRAMSARGAFGYCSGHTRKHSWNILKAIAATSCPSLQWPIILVCF
jgi:hypothetical protein